MRDDVVTLTLPDYAIALANTSESEPAWRHGPGDRTVIAATPHGSVWSHLDANSLAAIRQIVREETGYPMPYRVVRINDGRVCAAFPDEGGAIDYAEWQNRQFSMEAFRVENRGEA